MNKSMKEREMRINLKPIQVAQLIRASSWYTKIVGSISNQGTYKK